jgi:N-acetylglucosamine kinase-like BadF-type ATPase
MKYYIGVDGGGTKTYYALFDENKNIIADVKTAGSNHENLEGSFDEAAAIIQDGITQLTKRAGIAVSDVSFTLMGLAGIDHPFQHDEMCKRLEKFGLKNFAIYNDGFIVVKAGSESGAAIGLNNGTGTCCNAIDSTGRMLQLAGLGDFSGDMGNGHWIARMAFKAIYDDVYLGIRKTSMTAMCYERFNIKTREQFLGSVALLDSEQSEEYIMALIDFFFDGLKNGDEACVIINDMMAERSAQLIAAHAAQLTFNGEEIEVVLSGSILTKLPSDIYLDEIKKRVAKKSGRKFKFIKLTQPPVTGCINWILQEYV